MYSSVEEHWTFNPLVLGSNPNTLKFLEYSQVARHSFLVRAFRGSNPLIPQSAGIAQLVRVSGCGSERHGFDPHYAPF